MEQSRDKYTKVTSIGDVDYEFDTLTGERRKITFGEQITVKREWNKEPVLQFAEILRNKNEGVHKDRHNHYAVIPMWLQLQMYKAGVPAQSIWGGGDARDVTRYINKYAPQYKVTNLWHDSPKAGKKDVRIQVKPGD